MPRRALERLIIYVPTLNGQLSYRQNLRKSKVFHVSREYVLEKSVKIVILSTPKCSERIREQHLIVVPVDKTSSTIRTFAPSSVSSWLLALPPLGDLIS